MRARNWNDVKRDQKMYEGCRICGDTEVDAAHIAGRTYDERIGKATIKVSPLSVLPLCREHHQQYDTGYLSILPYLQPDEVAQAIRDAGSVSAMIVKTCRKDAAERFLRDL